MPPPDLPPPDDLGAVPLAAMVSVMLFGNLLSSHLPPKRHASKNDSNVQIRVWDSSGRSVFSLDSRNRAHPVFASNGELRSIITHFLLNVPRIHLILT